LALACSYAVTGLTIGSDDMGISALEPDASGDSLLDLDLAATDLAASDLQGTDQAGTDLAPSDLATILDMSNACAAMACRQNPGGDHACRKACGTGTAKCVAGHCAP
jgi:hypothetical protein